MKQQKKRAKLPLEILGIMIAILACIATYIALIPEDLRWPFDRSTSVSNPAPTVVGESPTSESDEDEPAVMPTVTVELSKTPTPSITTLASEPPAATPAETPAPTDVPIATPELGPTQALTYLDRGLLGWQRTTSLPESLAYSGAAAQNDVIYVVGGQCGGRYSNEVYSAQVLADGSLGAWRNLKPLPEPRAGHAVVLHNGRIYVVSGRRSDESLPNPAVYYTSIGDNGDIGSWETTAKLHEGLIGISQMAIAHRDSIYILGGGKWYGPGPYYDTVYQAFISSDGSLGSWAQVSTLPEKMRNASVIAAGGKIYLIGGYNINKKGLSSVFYVDINPDGSLGEWHSTASLPERVWESAALLNGDMIYVVGGGPDGEDVQRRAFYAVISEDSSVSEWTADDDLLPRGLHAHSAVIVDSRLYVIGGLNVDVPQDTVFFASLGGE